MQNCKRIKYIIGTMLLAGLAGSALAAQKRMLESQHEIAIGAGPIYFQPLGYFGEQFNGGFGGVLQSKVPGVLFFSGQPLDPFTLFFDVGFLFSTQALTERSTGSMTTFSLVAGPGLLYPWHRFFQPAVLLQAGFFYNRLTLGSRGETYHAYNPAVRLQVGIHSPLTASVFVETRAALPFYYLGDRNLAGPEFGLAINYLLRPGEIVMTQADKHFLDGKALYEEGKYAEADANFTAALQADKSHAGAANYRRMIGAHENLARARASREKQEVFSSLAYYQQAAAYLTPAEQELREFRASLAGNVTAMVSEGISHYEARRFAECERLMERALLIQPDNVQARIYLPRARSRRQALEKLQ